MTSFRDGWECHGLLEYYAKKSEIKKKIEEQLKADGKTLEDAIENVYIEENNEEKDEKRNYRRSSSRLLLIMSCLIDSFKSYA